MLIDEGAEVDAIDVQGETPLHEAVAYGAIGVTQVPTCLFFAAYSITLH